MYTIGTAAVSEYRSYRRVRVAPDLCCLRWAVMFAWVTDPKKVIWF